MTMLALVLCAANARAGDRIALVIGNSAYSTVGALDNPTRDATLIADTLERIGFRVTRLIDSSQSDMKRAISQFGRDLRDAGSDTTGLFYYAGHGVQSFGANYLLPVDVALSDAADLDLMAVEAQSVLRQMASARNQTNIVILDACRNNPFTAIPEFEESGLAEMKAPTGTYLAYATAPGGVALDGADDNSPFTQALARNMTRPGVAIEQVFKRVRVEVLDVTSGRQTPWDSSSLTSDFVFVDEPRATPEELAEISLWTSVQATGDPVQIMLFLRAYPGSRFETEARALLAETMENELSAGKAPEPATSGPGDDEQALFETAQSTGTAAAYQAYLDAFPRGTFAEIASQEIAALNTGTSTDPVGEGVTPEVAQAPPPPPEAVAPGDVTFTSVLIAGNAQVQGRSIAQLIEGAPLFPPVEGLPDEYWKDQQCSNCHTWTPTALCDQANIYLAQKERSLTKQHPMGGGLKLNLRAWAAGGCRP